MDEAAARSHQRAARAQATGRFDDEIVPINAWTKDKNGHRVKVVVAKDDGVRAESTAEKLGKIRQAFPQWPPSQTTGGNARSALSCFHHAQADRAIQSNHRRRCCSLDDVQEEGE